MRKKAGGSGVEPITYQIDAAMLGPLWAGDVREFAADLQREVTAQGWSICIEPVDSHNGARNVDEDGCPLDDLLPVEFDALFWAVAERHNTAS